MTTICRDLVELAILESFSLFQILYSCPSRLSANLGGAKLVVKLENFTDFSPQDVTASGGKSETML